MLVNSPHMKGIASFFPSPSIHNGQGHTACNQPVPRQSGTIILLMSRFVTDDKLEDISVGAAFEICSVVTHLFPQHLFSMWRHETTDTTLAPWWCGGTSRRWAWFRAVCSSRGVVCGNRRCRHIRSSVTFIAIIKVILSDKQSIDIIHAAYSPA